MFDGVASSYDLLNRIISLGLDQGWRKKTTRALALGPGATVLDLATGTGDLAIVTASEHKDARIIAIDPSRGMLDVAAGKVAHFGGRIDLRLGDAQALDLPDASVDAVTMAFGIRNVPDRPKALRQMARVTKPGGRIAILELSEPRHGLLGALARFHIHTVVPSVGGILTGSFAYSYLQRSIAAFPAPEQFATVMDEAGLRVLEVTPLTFGVVCLYVGTPRPR